jgi:hypothetical protein
MFIVVGRILALVTLLVLLVRAATNGDPMSRGIVFGLACVATLVICPVARACYYLLFLPAIPFVAGRLLELGKPRTSLFFAWFPVALVWLHYLFLPNVGRLGLLGLGATAWFLAGCILLERRHITQPEVSLTSQPASPSREPERESLLAAV